MPLLPRTLRAAAPLAATSAALLVLVGCAATPATPVATSGAAPVVVDNCGTTVTVDAPPKRIVTIKSTSTEMLLALGLGDRILGTAFPDGPTPADLAGDTDIPVISDFAPSSEAVLALEPDFVYGGWESNFSADAAGDRTMLQGLGIGTYVSPSACKEPGYQPEKMTFDVLFDEIAQAGEVFGATDAATALVAKQKDELAAIPTDGRGLTALWYSSGDDQPYVGAGIGAPQMILEKLGLSNVFAGVKDTWTSASWEAVVDADPDVIVLVDASWNTADSKIAALEKNPATANLSAVKAGHYLVIPFAAGEAGVRNVPATADLATQLAALDLG